MKRAALVLVAVLAGCGNGGKDDARVAAPEPTPPPAATATTSAAPSPQPKKGVSATPTSAPAPTATPLTSNRAIKRGVAAYLIAVNAHDIASVCAGFTGRTPPACGGPGPHLAERPMRQGPQFDRLTVTRRPGIRRHGRRATAAVRVVVLSDGGGREASTETLRLQQKGGRWVVNEPSPVFYRAINRQAP